MTELEIVNSMLRLESQAALNSLDDDHPMVDTCKAIIREALSTVLNQGWWFNTRKITLYPDSTGAILKPYGLLAVREVCNVSGIALADFDGVLVDMNGQELNDPLVVWAVMDRPITSLPPVAAEVVRGWARYLYASDVIKDPTEADKTQREYQWALMKLRAEHIRQTQSNQYMGNTYVKRMDYHYRRNRANRRF